MKKIIRNDTCIDLSEKVAVVIGGTGSIGEEISIALLKSNASVVVASRYKNSISLRLNEFLKNSKKISYQKTDVTSEASIKKLYNVVLEKYGKVDILILAHGIQIRKPFRKLSIKEWGKIIDVNLTGTFLVCKYFSEPMVKEKQGKIIGITSLTSKFGIRDISAYASSKGGMSIFLKTIAIELSEYNININMVAPGRIETKMTKNILSNEEIRLSNLRCIPMRRFGLPSDITGAVMFLSSNSSNYITGETIIVDGGWTASMGNIKK